MNERIKPLTIYRIILWTSVTTMSSFFVFTILAVVLKDVFKDKQIIMIILFSLFTVASTITGTFSGHAISEQKRIVDQIKIENTYTLGEPTQFYNLDAFKKRVTLLAKRRSYAGRNKYIIAMTPTALNIASNRNRDKTVSAVNLKLAHFFDDLFMKTGSEFEKRNCVYGFSRGVFLFCYFTNDESKIHQLLNVISNECYRMVNEDKVKIWIQPFYGIKLEHGSFSAISAIEDAVIARNYSEKNYEAYTYFKESFRVNIGTESKEISEALANDEFVAYYQPKYSLKEHRYVSCEALARWNSPKNGLLGPAKFIDEAEKAGLLSAIDACIFEKAIKDLSDNIKRGRPVLPVSVNFSLYEFFSRNFLNTIIDTLNKYQVPPRLLEIEITETTSQVNKFLSLSVIKKLKGFGIRVLMDDFGAGYSQIENLRQIPFDAIKIDKSFTDRIVDDEKTRSIFKYLVELGHVNNMEVIVEGAETKAQIDLLRRLKVDTIQGFYYSRPLSTEQYNELLKNNQEKGAK